MFFDWYQQGTLRSTTVRYYSKAYCIQDKKHQAESSHLGGQSGSEIVVSQSGIYGPKPIKSETTG